MRIITYDIEVSPRLIFAYGTDWEPKFVKEKIPQELLSFAWKELDKPRTHVIALCDHSTEDLLKEIWRVFDSADVLISYNGDKFDKRMMNAFFLKAGMTPPSSCHSIDLLKVVRKNFMFPGNSLKKILKELGMQGKMEVDFDDWEGCLNQCPKAWARMKKYNKVDVVRTEELFYKLRPWLENISLSDGGCPSCGSTNHQKRGFFYNKTRTHKKQRYVCNDCGKFWSGKIHK